MAHLIIPDDLIDALRPHVEDAWERSQREAGRRSISANEVVVRALKKVVPKPPSPPQLY